MTNYRIDATFLQGEGTIEKTTFHDGNLCLLFHSDEGRDRLNSNLPEVKTPSDCIWVKDYAEHDGLALALITAGICAPAELPDLVNSYGAGWVLLKVLI
jgi:hypothetical protein